MSEEPNALLPSQAADGALMLPDPATLDTAILRQQLADSLTLTAHALAYLARVWAELERRGEDLSDLRTGLSLYLPAIAAGKLDARLVVQYAGKRMLLDAASRLPLEEQQRLLETDAVSVVTVDAAGERQVAQTPLGRLRSADIRFVFAEDRVRSIEEQYHLRSLSALRGRKTKRPPLRLKVGKRAIPLEQVLDALSALYGCDARAVLEAAGRKEDGDG